MKLLIDLQGAQAANARRGIGRYSISLAEAIIRNQGTDEVHLLLNERFVESAIELRRHFSELLPTSAIHSFDPMPHIPLTDQDGYWVSDANGHLLESVVASLRPDAVLTTSLFEGCADDAVTRASFFTAGIPTAVVLYDLIPHLFPSVYLTDTSLRSWYDQRFRQLSDADVLLAISESSRNDALAEDVLPADRVVNISSAVSDSFFETPIDDPTIMFALGVSGKFLLYAGGIDERKNIVRLLEAFAAVAAPIRGELQLVITCAIEPATRDHLLALCADLGLDAGDVLFTGWVSDETLRLLYDQCTGFVFPSWYEGFGLPVLEAMAAGAAVIASNSSSMPEVVGRVDALFDPLDVDSIRQAIERLLTDSIFREDLARTGRQRAKSFSWDATALAAIAAIKTSVARFVPLPTPIQRPRLAYVSPLSPLPTGISDYSAELIPELTQYYDIDLISTTAEKDQILAGCPVRSVEWFRHHHLEFDRVLYHVGNSEFHQHMFELMAIVPGVVVLHDFYLSSIMSYMDAMGVSPGCWATSLYHSHGYAATQMLATAADGSDVVWHYPANLQTIQDADGVIVHSEFSRRLARDWYGENADDGWATIPHARVPVDASHQARLAARKALGIPADKFVVASFGMTGPTKLNHVLMDGFEASSLASEHEVCLFFVGENQKGAYGDDLAARLAAHEDIDRVRCTGRVDAPTYQMYLLACDVAVQLRTNSRGETSGAILDCLNVGAALIANASGSQAELPPSVVKLLHDDVSATELASALEELRNDDDARAQLGAAGMKLVRTKHGPAACAKLYHQAIEKYAHDAGTRASLRNEIASHFPHTASDTALVNLAEACARSLPPKPRQPQLFVDVSELAAHDAESGIQRVTKSVLRQLFLSAPSHLRVEPVAATASVGYQYARAFTERFLGVPVRCADETPIEYGPKDIFLGLDLQPLVITRHEAFFKRLSAAGTKVFFVVYDLLPLEIPEAFYPAAADLHSHWLRVVAEADGALCISQSVADQLSAWVKEHAPHRIEHLAISSFQLGADLSSSTPSSGYPDDAVETLSVLAERPTFTMVGTIEPRKAHRQVLDGFERLWQAGVDVNLVIVGKPGWLVDDLLDRLRTHPERGNRLHWMSAASDEYLNSIYQFSDCLIAASWAEGFGLPLVEASLHHLPVIARDISVFRELAGDHAHYFSGLTGADVAVAVTEWLGLQATGGAESSRGIPCVSWQESTAQLLNRVLREPSV